MPVLKQTLNKSDIKSCSIRRIKKCPPAVSKKEPPIAEELRAIMSENVYINTEGFLYIFYNQLTKYPPKPCNTCQFIYQGLFRTISIAELENDPAWLKVNDQYLYPMLVWATMNDDIHLVRLRPGHKKPVKLLKRPNDACEAFMICASVTSIND